MILSLVRILLRLELWRLERQTVRPFHQGLSCAIDRVVCALESLGWR